MKLLSVISYAETQLLSSESSKSVGNRITNENFILKAILNKDFALLREIIQNLHPNDLLYFWLMDSPSVSNLSDHM